MQPRKFETKVKQDLENISCEVFIKIFQILNTICIQYHIKIILVALCTIAI